MKPHVQAGETSSRKPARNQARASRTSETIAPSVPLVGIEFRIEGSMAHFCSISMATYSGLHLIAAKTGRRLEEVFDAALKALGREAQHAPAEVAP